MPSRFFKYRWASQASKEGAINKKKFGQKKQIHSFQWVLWLCYICITYCVTPSQVTSVRIVFILIPQVDSSIDRDYLALFEEKNSVVCTIPMYWTQRTIHMEHSWVCHLSRSRNLTDAKEHIPMYIASVYEHSSTRSFLTAVSQ